MTSAPTLRPPRCGPVPAPSREMGLWVWKVAMALTGGVWALFVLIHLFGNLKVYLGAHAYDGYAHWLREVGYPLVPHQSVLWALRVVLLVCLVVHITAALVLRSKSRRARGAVKAAAAPTVSRWMTVTGILIAVFIVVHVLDLTVGAGVASDHFTQGSAYANLVASLSRPWMGIFYTLIMVLVAAHLWHGVVLAFNDLGTTSKRWRAVAKVIAGCVAVAIVLGNAVIPVVILVGLIR